MDPIFHDPNFAQQKTNKFNTESKKMARILEISNEKDKKMAERNTEARFESLKTKLKLTQGVAEEKAVALEAAIKQIDELQAKFEVASGRTKKYPKEVQKMKDQLNEREKQVEDLKEKLLQATMRGDTLEARMRDMDSVIKDLQRKLNGESIVSFPSDVDGVNSLYRRSPTIIPIPSNHPKIAPKKFKRADSDQPEIDKFNPNAYINRDLPVSKVSYKEPVVHTLSDSPAFQMFWKKLGILTKAIPSRRKINSPVCGNGNWTRRDLKRHLDELYQPFGFTSEFIFLLHGLLRWGPEKVNALAFVPLFIIKNGVWTHNNEFANVDGDTIEVFCVDSESSGVCYVGTYKCYHARDYFPEGVRKPKDISGKSLSKLTVAYNNKNALQSDAGYSRRYSMGELKVDCAILECVGFNEALYEELSPVNGDEMKRKASSAFGSKDLRSAKRARM